MIFRESETVELKEIVVEDIKKEIIAFANCNGGKLYVGVRKDGTVAGVDDPDSVSLQISNMVRDSIKPDITLFIRYETIKTDEGDIVAVDVQRGTDRPYYLANKGMRQDGVYVRQGYSAVQATDTAIRHMIKETDGDRFEAMRSLNQELTFNAAKKKFDERKVEFGPSQMHTLKLIDRDNLYTNLGLLLSDQCVHTVKMAVFQGTDQMVFKNRREFSGSLLKQLSDIEEQIERYNQLRSTIEGLVRIDVKDYPDIAIRETLMNLLVHRNYSFSSSANISIYSNRMEFVSLGGLVPEIEKEDLAAGISACRNQDLANVFFRLHYIEAYGTGIRKIIDAYEGVPEKPKFKITKNTFAVILPNINAKYERNEYEISKRQIHSFELPSSSVGLVSGVDASAQEKKILQYVRVNGSITSSDVKKLIGVSSATSYRILNKMVSNKLLRRNGKTKTTVYTL